MAGALALASPAAAQPDKYPVIDWKDSVAVGQPWNGHLVRGVKLPAEGPDWFTWDPALNRQPDRWWRRYGTDALVWTVLEVIEEYRIAHPEAPRVGVGDLSRPHGGPFGRQYGGLGHNSHQNGLDADIWYPRRDGTERRAFRVADVNLKLAQDLVDRFVKAGAVRVFVGPHTGLTGPPRIVRKLIYHDDHLHVRIARP